MIFYILYTTFHCLQKNNNNNNNNAVATQNKLIWNIKSYPNDHPLGYFPFSFAYCW